MRRVLRFHAAKGRSADSMGRRRVSSAIEIYYKERESDMANRNGKCPKCGGELSIPEELAKFSCMYCGAVLTQEELVIIQEKKEKNPLGEILQKLYENGDEKAEDLIDQMLELDQYDAKANEIYARLHFNEIIFEHLDVSAVRNMRPVLKVTRDSVTRYWRPWIDMPWFRRTKGSP